MTKDNPIRVAALTQGVNVASRRFRLEQYLPRLSNTLFKIDELISEFGSYPPSNIGQKLVWAPRTLLNSYARARSANAYDMCFLQRELVATMYTFESYIHRPILFDIDDALFLATRGSSSEKIAKKSKLIICGNDFLANHYCKFGEVTIIPTPVDTSRYSLPDQMKRDNLDLIIGWSGSSGGFKYLYSIERALKSVLELNPSVTLKIISDSPPKFTHIPNNRVRYVKWTFENEIEELQDIDIGIMPLNDNNWEKGKCSFKMLTYMAVGKPVVVSPVGMNCEILQRGLCGTGAGNDDEWIGALDFYIRDRRSAHACGITGRAIVQEFYSLEANLPKFVNALNYVYDNR